MLYALFCNCYISPSYNCSDSPPCFCVAQMRDQARRFITLVDELYNAKTPLFISADAWPMELFMKPGDTPVLDLEGLQFETAIAGLSSTACSRFNSKEVLLACFAGVSSLLSHTLSMCISDASALQEQSSEGIS